MRVEIIIDLKLNGVSNFLGYWLRLARWILPIRGFKNKTALISPLSYKSTIIFFHLVNLLSFQLVATFQNQCFETIISVPYMSALYHQWTHIENSVLLVSFDINDRLQTKSNSLLSKTLKFLFFLIYNNK